MILFHYLIIVVVTKNTAWYIINLRPRIVFQMQHEKRLLTHFLFEEERRYNWTVAIFEVAGIVY